MFVVLAQRTLTNRWGNISPIDPNPGAAQKRVFYAVASGKAMPITALVSAVCGFALLLVALVMQLTK
jgi:hypothetical protein